MLPVRVLYIASTPRSGSTLVGNILGQAPGFFHVGELNRLWFRLVRRPSTTCGCGDELAECPFWSQVIDRVESAAGFPGRAEIDRMVLADQGLRGFAKQKVKAPDDAYRDTIEATYRAVSDLTEGQVIVDSSKKAGYGATLAALPSLDVRFVHLVRDPRGMAASRTRRARAESGLALRARSLLADSLRWAAWNLAGESLAASGRGVRVNYENLTANPRPAVETALALFDADVDLAPAIDGKTVKLAPTHTVWGNRSRFNTGAVDIVDDRRWVAELSPWERRLAAGLPGPLLSRYGYSREVAGPREISSGSSS